MKLTLKPFQEEGTNFLATHPHALLADDPGLGKTPQALAAVEKVGAGDILVVCPASVVYHWENQIVKFLGLDWLQNFDVVSYHSVHKMPKTDSWDVIICDEAHYLKTLTSNRTQAVFGPEGVARRSHYKWMLSGTPVLNRPRELYPMLKALWGHKLGSYNDFHRFALRYCGAFYEQGRGMNDRGASNLDELALILNQFMLRRTQEQVLPELPEAVVERVPIEMSPADWALIDTVESEIENREEYISSAYEQFSQMGDSSRLLRVTGLAKARSASEFIKEQLKIVPKIVVFARHRDVIDDLERRLRAFNPVLYRGGMLPAAKAEAKLQFMTDPKCMVFLGNIQAAGTGIDGLQTVCNTVVFAELSWVPEEMKQCVHRLKRMGLMKDAKRVNAYVLHTPGTLESGVLGSHDGKVPVINRILGEAEGHTFNVVPHASLGDIA